MTAGKKEPNQATASPTLLSNSHPQSLLATPQQRMSISIHTHSRPSCTRTENTAKLLTTPTDLNGQQEYHLILDQRSPSAITHDNTRRDCRMISAS